MAAPRGPLVDEDLTVQESHAFLEAVDAAGALCRAVEEAAAEAALRARARGDAPAEGRLRDAAEAARLAALDVDQVLGLGEGPLRALAVARAAARAALAALDRVADLLAEHPHP